MRRNICVENNIFAKKNVKCLTDAENIVNIYTTKNMIFMIAKLNNALTFVFYVLKTKIMKHSIFKESVFLRIIFMKQNQSNILLQMSKYSFIFVKMSINVIKNVQVKAYVKSIFKVCMMEFVNLQNINKFLVNLSVQKSLNLRV